MVHGALGEDMDHAITNVGEVFKENSDIVIIPPPPMAVNHVQDTIKWLRLVTCIIVQVIIFYQFGM